MKNVLSIDLERWSDRRLINYDDIENINDDVTSLYKGLDEILNLLNKYKYQGTFFIVAKISKIYPELIENIIDEGHEIALHGWSHNRLENLNPKIFEKEILKSIKSIMHITRERPKGFRAPDFSLNKKTGWALKILIENKFVYDSSIFPCRVPLYGKMVAPYYPYYPSIENPEIIDITQRRIIELPLLINKTSFFRMPAAGGFWLRLFGPKFVLSAVKKMNKRGIPSILYIHPWELVKITLSSRKLKTIYAHYNIPIKNQLKFLLKNIDFCPAIDLIKEY